MSVYVEFCTNDDNMVFSIDVDQKNRKYDDNNRRYL